MRGCRRDDSQCPELHLKCHLRCKKMWRVLYTPFFARRICANGGCDSSAVGSCERTCRDLCARLRPYLRLFDGFRGAYFFRWIPECPSYEFRASEVSAVRSIRVTKRKARVEAPLSISQEGLRFSSFCVTPGAFARNRSARRSWFEEFSILWCLCQHAGELQLT